MKNNLTFGKKIEYIRKELGLSRKEFADKMGISESTLGRYERDETIPSYSFLVTFKKKLGMDSEVLFQPEIDVPKLFSDDSKKHEKKDIENCYVFEEETPVLFCKNKREEVKQKQFKLMKEINILFDKYFSNKEK